MTTMVITLTGTRRRQGGAGGLSRPLALGDSSAAIWISKPGGSA